MDRFSFFCRVPVASSRALLLLFAAWGMPLPGQAVDLTLEAQANAYAELDPALRGSAALTLGWNASAREPDGSTHTLDIQVFGRYADGADSGRRHADVRELIYTRAYTNWEWRFGMGRVFWGVTEAVHLVDIINQDDALEDIDGEDKLGQPLLAVARRIGNGRAQALLLPRFRERRFSPVFQELSPFPIAENQTRFASSRGDQHTDLALRLTQNIFGVDLGLSLFEGTAREPRLLPCAAQGSGRPGTQNQANCNLEEAFAPPATDPLTELLLTAGDLFGVGPDREQLEAEFIAAAMADVVLVPQYDQIQQVGLDLQWILGPAAWKLEARYRDRGAAQEWAAVAGIEYSLGVFGDGIWDVGLSLEYLYDDRAGDTLLNLFDDDIFIGTRILGNDIAGTQLLGGFIIDREAGDLFWSFEASRRIGGGRRLAIETRGFAPRRDDMISAALDQLDTVRIQIEQFF